MEALSKARNMQSMQYVARNWQFKTIGVFMLKDDIKVIETAVTFQYHRDAAIAWGRIKKAALESCQQPITQQDRLEDSAQICHCERRDYWLRNHRSILNDQPYCPGCGGKLLPC